MDVNKTLKDLRAAMQKAVDFTVNEYNKLHTGKASPSMVELLNVEAYGSVVKLKEIAAIMTPDARTIQIQPWDKSVIKDIEKAIQVANLGLNPVSDGTIIRCPIPELSRERRQELAKVAKGMAEEGRVRLRTIRRDVLEAVKKAQKAGTLSEDDAKRLEKDIQTETDRFNASIDKSLEAKEKELMKV